MPLVENYLVIGVGVNGGHYRALDLERIVDDLRRGSQAVGGAGSIGNDMVLCRVVLSIVDAEDDGQIFVLCWGRDDDFLAPPFTI
jgi:hypothetical protein